MKAGSIVIAAALSAVPSVAQNTKPAPGAREYFFLAVQKKDALPPLQRASHHQPRTSTPASANGVPHLGLRYTLLLENQETGKVRAVDPDHNFRVGDCVALRLESNRTGYLYVLAKQSSGTWFPLLPSPQMASESNVIEPGEPLQVPKEFCFAIKNPPGEEELFVALSRDPAAIGNLNDDVRKPAPPPAPAAEPSAKPAGSEFPGEGAELADARSLNQEVAALNNRYSTRDIMIVKVGSDQSAKAEEPTRSVYVVNGSSQPTSNVVAHIIIHHR